MTYRYCSQCGSEHSTDSRFCATCGTPRVTQSDSDTTLVSFPSPSDGNGHLPVNGATITATPPRSATAVPIFVAQAESRTDASEVAEAAPVTQRLAVRSLLAISAATGAVVVIASRLGGIW